MLGLYLLNENVINAVSSLLVILMYKLLGVREKWRVSLNELFKLKEILWI